MFMPSQLFDLTATSSWPPQDTRRPHCELIPMWGQSALTLQSLGTQHALQHEAFDCHHCWDSYTEPKSPTKENTNHHDGNFKQYNKTYLNLWKLIISKFILWKPFWNRTLRYHRNGTLKSFSGLLPFSGRCHIPNVLRSQLFRILTKYISLERSESQDSIFGGHFVIRVIVGEKLIHLWQKSA